MPETVTLARQAVVDLLIEAHGVACIVEDLSGVSPVGLTADLVRTAEIVAEGLLGPVTAGPEGESIGPRVELWDSGAAVAREFFQELADKRSRRAPASPV